MADRLSPAARSRHMSRIKRAGTHPEMIVRKLLHSMGYRFRTQWRPAPGRPDVAFPGRRKIIYVHGCFWHQHDQCRISHVPQTRPDFWRGKFERNKARDQQNLKDATSEGWEALVIWECNTRDLSALRLTLAEFVGATRNR